MNLRERLLAYPATEELRGVLDRKKTQNAELQRLPPPIVLAHGFLEEGSLGLRELMARFSRRNVAIVPDWRFARSLSDEQARQFREYYSAVIFGTSSLSLHEMLIEGLFDDKIWCARHNVAITGTGLTPLRPSLIFLEPLSGEQLTVLRELGTSDRTLTTFFDRWFGYLPKMLQQRLLNSATLPTINQSIIPAYLERAHVLVAG